MMIMQCMQDPRSTRIRYVHSVSSSTRRHSAIEADHVADMSLVGAIGSGAGGGAFRILASARMHHGRCLEARPPEMGFAWRDLGNAGSELCHL